MTAQPIPLHHPLLDFARTVNTGATAVADLDPMYMSPDTLRAALIEMLAASDKVQLLSGRLLDACDDLAASEGFRDVAAWAAKHTHQPPDTLRAQVRFAESLRERWAPTADAVMAGEISLAQARVIGHCLDNLREADATLRGEGDLGVDPDIFTQAEARLIAHAVEFGPRKLRILGERILSILAPDVADRHEQAALAEAERRAATACRLNLRRRGDGTVDLHARLSEAAAVRLTRLIDAYASPRTGGHDKPAAGFGITDPATGMKLSAERIRGQAFETLLENLDPSQIPAHGGGTTQIVVTIDHDTLMTGLGTATLGHDTPITAGHARRLACKAGLLPAVLDGESQVLDWGRSKRFFTLAQRQAAALTNPTCSADACTVPAENCEAHHAEPWSQGGTTDQEHLDLFCPHHHHRTHDPAYITTRLPNGKYTFTRRR